MTATMIQICVPTRSRNARYLFTTLIVYVMEVLPIVGNFKKHPYIEICTAKPQPISFYMRKHFLVSYSIGVTNH